MQYVVFLGSARDTTPPKPAQLGARVARACVRWLTEQGHDVRLIDPLDYELGGSFKPHFSCARGQAPQVLETLAGHIRAADSHYSERGDPVRPESRLSRRKESPCQPEAF